MAIDLDKLRRKWESGQDLSAKDHEIIDNFSADLTTIATYLIEDTRTPDEQALGKELYDFVESIEYLNRTSEQLVQEEPDPEELKKHTDRMAAFSDFLRRRGVSGATVYETIMDIGLTEKEEEAQKKYDEIVKRYETRRQKLTELVEHAKINLEDAEKDTKEAETKLKHSQESSDNSLNAYRRKTEVFLEGVADLRRTGEVTEANNFANTRLLTQKCVGCSLEKPESQREIAACYASSIVEEKLRQEYVKNPAFSGGQTSSIQLKGLNNGSIVESILRDPVFQQALKELRASKQEDYLKKNKADAKLFALGDDGVVGPAPGADPDAYRKALARYEDALLFDGKDDLYRLKDQMKTLTRASGTPVARLNDLRKSVIQEFGKRPITEDCMVDIMRLKVIDEQIKKEKKREAAGEDTSKKYVEGDFKAIVSDITMNPHSGKPIILSNVQRYLAPDWMNAIRQAEKTHTPKASEPHKAAEYVHGAVWKQLEENVQNAGPAAVEFIQKMKAQADQAHAREPGPIILEEYDLETMAKLVTEQHDKLVKGKDKGPERNQS